MQHAGCSVQCIAFSVKCALYSVQYSVCSIECTVFSVQYAVCSVQLRQCWPLPARSWLLGKYFRPLVTLARYLSGLGEAFNFPVSHTHLIVKFYVRLGFTETSISIGLTFLAGIIDGPSLV